MAYTPLQTDFIFRVANAFGFVGEAFVAQFGDMAPEVGKVLAPVGFKVVRVDVHTGVIRDFAVNKEKNVISIEVGVGYAFVMQSWLRLAQAA